MLSAARQKFLTSLHLKKYRYAEQCLLVEGEKMVAELLVQSRLKVREVYGTAAWAAANGPALTPFIAHFQEVTESELNKISTLTTPNKVLAVVDFPRLTPDWERIGADYAFYTDDLQDPGNLGTLLRIADWFGLSAVFCSPNTVDPFSPKVVQAGMGAFLRVPTFEMPLSEVLARLPDCPVIGAVMDGENALTARFPGRGLLVIGNEGRGISPETDARLTQRLTIPRAAAGGAESLNAGVAAGILTALVRR
jgi:RNA methyltransferase, TrmH family